MSTFINDTKRDRERKSAIACGKLPHHSFDTTFMADRLRRLDKSFTGFLDTREIETVKTAGGNALRLRPSVGVYPAGPASDRLTDGTGLSGITDAGVTHHYPARCVIEITVEKKNGQLVRASGVLVGPASVLCSAHQLLDLNPNYGDGSDPLKWHSWAKSVYCTPGAAGTYAGHQGCYAWEAYVDDEYMKGGKAENDIALLSLKEPIGVELGYLGLTSMPSTAFRGRKAFTAGYPGGVSRQSIASVTLEPVAKGFWFDHEGKEGASGSPVYVAEETDRYVVGILNGGNDKTHMYDTARTFAARVTNERFKFFWECIHGASMF